MTETPAPAQTKKRAPILLITITAAIALIIGAAGGFLSQQPQLAALNDRLEASHKNIGDLRTENRDLKTLIESTAAPVTESEPAPESGFTIQLPEGYPALVHISELPAHMQSSFEMAGSDQAVAVAPGVWAEYPPGATIEDAVNARSFSGFCASKEAFEREYLNGESTSGSCW